MRLQNDVHPLATSMSVLTTLLCCFRTVRGQAPPSVTGKSNAPASVPDYVVKYGMNIKSAFPKLRREGRDSLNHADQQSVFDAKIKGKKLLASLFYMLSMIFHASRGNVWSGHPSGQSDISFLSTASILHAFKTWNLVLTEFLQHRSFTCIHKSRTNHQTWGLKSPIRHQS